MKNSRLPVVVIAGAAVAVLALTIALRRDVRAPQATERANPIAQGAAQHVRSARVEERLQLLRDIYAQRQRASQPQQPELPKESEPRRSEPTPAGIRANVETARPGEIARGRRASWAVRRDPAPAAQVAGRKRRAPGQHRIGDLFVFHPAYLDEHWDTQRIENTILNGTNIEQRRAALDLLVGEDDARAISILLTALSLNDPDPNFRAAVVSAAEDYAEALSPAVFGPALQDESPQVRFEAVWVLGGMDTPEARDTIQTAVNDTDPDVSDLARGILEMTD